MKMEMKINKGQVLINEGEPSDCIYMLNSGELAIYKYDPTAKRHNVIARVLPGEIVGEMSFLDNLPRSASVKAQTDCDVTVMNRAAFESMLSTQEPMIQELIKTLADRLRKTNAKIKF